MKPKHAKFLERYWLKHYSGSAGKRGCTLCGNSGIIDTRGVKTAAGIEVGCLQFCICPNGRELRAQRADITQWPTGLDSR